MGWVRVLRRDRQAVATRLRAEKSPESCATSRALSRGGRYTLDNIAPACGSCNASKCNDEVTGWLRRKRLDERAFLLRHIEIGAALALRFGAAPDAGQETELGTSEATAS